MRFTFRATVALLVLAAMPAWASGDCNAHVIRASADVSVSDGSTFTVESFFAGADAAAIRFVDENELLIAVEGDHAWVSQNGKAQPAGDGQKIFALGHQFHALLLFFDELASDVRPVSGLLFGDKARDATGGEYPYGGSMFLVPGVDGQPAEGLVFELPESPRMEVRFSDWRRIVDMHVPYEVQIDDGKLVFDYRYSDVNLSDRTATWFQDNVAAPGIEAVVAARALAQERAVDCENP